MGDMGEGWKQLKEERKERKIKRQASNSEIVLGLQGDMQCDYEVKTIAPYHLRLFNDKKALDYFPQTGKASWVGSNNWFKISDIEQYIMKHFKSEV